MTQRAEIERLVEPIARAICCADGTKDADAIGRYTHEPLWTLYIDEARAVLQSDAISGLIKQEEDDREARWAKWPQGDAGDAIDYACDHVSPMPKMRWFLEDWRAQRADEWPDYMRWLNVQRDGARAALNPKTEGE